VVARKHVMCVCVRVFLCIRMRNVVCACASVHVVSVYLCVRLGVCACTA